MNDPLGTNSSDEYHSSISNDPVYTRARRIAFRRASVLVIDGVAPACTLLRLARRQVMQRCLIIYVQQRPLCVLLDLDHHGAAALEVCRAIRALPETTDTITMLMSSRCSVEQFDAALLAGADELLFKPLTTEELLTRVEMVLQADRHSAEELRRRCERLCKQRALLEASKAASELLTDA